MAEIRGCCPTTASRSVDTVDTGNAENLSAFAKGAIRDHDDEKEPLRLTGEILYCKLRKGGLPAGRRMPTRSANQDPAFPFPAFAA